MKDRKALIRAFFILMELIFKVMKESGMMSNKPVQSNIIRINPNADFYFNRAWEAFDKNKLEQALKYFKRATSLSDNDGDREFGQCQTALIYQHLGNFQKSCDLINELIEKGSENYPEVHYFQANNYAFLGDYTKALKCTQMYLYLVPNGEYREEAEEFQKDLEEELNIF